MRVQQIGSGLAFVQRGGTRVRIFEYGYVEDQYTSVDVTMMSEHILSSGVKEMDLQTVQDPYIWCVLNDGSLVGLSYEKSQKVQAWHRHIFPNGRASSICIIPGDVSMKDSLYWGSGWLWDDTPHSFQPYLSPLMLDKGVVTVTAFPGAQGDTARLECTPASSYYTLVNTTKTRTPSAGRFRVSRNWLENGNELAVSGNVDGRRTGTVNIYSSQDFFMHTFLERLRAKGIHCLLGYSFREFQKDSVSVRMASYNTSVQAVVNQIMKESDNLNAEAMLCRLGAQFTGGRHVSAADGLSAVRQLIRKLGYLPDRYKLADGCGLSNYNYISSELLVAFLKFAYSRTDVFQKLYKALPIGGVDGTLKNRMKKGTLSYGKVHAKTGSFTAINCLAGYLKANNGHHIAFAIMNQNVLSGREARKFQDAVCDMLIR